MNFETLFLFSIISYSITFGYMESPLFAWLRRRMTELHKAYATCYHCVGFWISLIVALLFFDRGWNALLFAFFGSGMIIVYDKIITYLYCNSIPDELRLQRWERDNGDEKSGH